MCKVIAGILLSLPPKGHLGSSKEWSTFVAHLIEYTRMAILNTQQIKEINELIEKISTSVTTPCEIGAHDKSSLLTLLKAQTQKKEAIYFACKREYSDAVVTHFIKEKGATKNKFHKNNQSCIYILK
jgi:hypothetical protein